MPIHFTLFVLPGDNNARIHSDRLSNEIQAVGDNCNWGWKRDWTWWWKCVHLYYVQGCTNSTCGKQHEHMHRRWKKGREAKSLIDVPLRPGTRMCFAQDKAGLAFKPFSRNAWSSGTENSETKGVDWLHHGRHPIPCGPLILLNAATKTSMCKIKVEKHRNCG